MHAIIEMKFNISGQKLKKKKKNGNHLICNDLRTERTQ